MITPRTRGTPLGVRAFRAALRLLPRDLRDRHGAAMLEVFEALHRDARAAHGWRGALGVTMAELPGLLRLAVPERADRHRAGSRARAAAPAARTTRPATIPRAREEDVIDSFRQDVRYALRSLRRSPGFAAVAIATLALGIGANTAVFSIVNGVLLEPLPFAHPEELVAIGEGEIGGPSSDLSATSPGSFDDWRRQTTALRAMAAYTDERLTLTGRGEPEMLNGITTVGDLFGVLGVHPALGRVPSAEDDSTGRRVLVLADAAWRRYFGGAPDAVGRTVTLGGVPYTVIGVMPPAFHFPDRAAEYWTPALLGPEQVRNRDQYMYGVVARLRPGTSLARARSDMATIAARLRRDWPRYDSRLRIDVVPLRETIVGSARTRLGILMGAVVFVLLIACANLGNLMLARSVARRREIAVRHALGAARQRIVRQLLTESLVLALAGGMAGIAIGWGFLRLMLAQRSVALPRVDEIALDWRVLAFTLALAVAAGIAFGLVPALQLARARSAEALREGARAGTRHAWVRDALVVSELALATMLLAGAGLLLHSFALLTRVDPGFRTERLLTFSVQLPRAEPTFVPRSLERIRALPGVRAASVISWLPVNGRGIGAWLNIVDRPAPPNTTPPAEAYRVVDPAYFATVGVPLLHGRLPSGDETQDRAPAIVINEALARKYWPNEDPIGKEAWLGAPGNALFPRATIIGVVGNTRDDGLGADPIPIVYVPAGMIPEWRWYSYVIRTAADPTSVAGSVRGAIRALDPALPIQDVRTMDEQLRESTAPARWSMTLLGVFAAVALVLAAIGIFGVLSFLVTQRTRELGIRIALGAGPERVRWMIVSRGMVLAVIGGGAGLAGALALSRLIRSMLFGISAADPATHAAAVALLLAIAGFASYLPARRATRVDPMVALRSE